MAEKYGYWTVLGEDQKRFNRRHLRCQCRCGTIRVVSRQDLTSSKSKSCGCFQKQRMTELKGKHWRRDKVYWRWSGMIQRCTNPKHKSYKDYGARGITVEACWRTFERFIKDMGEPPTPEHTIERINNDGPYGPSNCRWATRLEQSKNRRVTSSH